MCKSYIVFFLVYFQQHTARFSNNLPWFAYVAGLYTQRCALIHIKTHKKMPFIHFRLFNLQSPFQISKKSPGDEWYIVGVVVLFWVGGWLVLCDRKL